VLAALRDAYEVLGCQGSLHSRREVRPDRAGVTAKGSGEGMKGGSKEHWSARGAEPRQKQPAKKMAVGPDLDTVGDEGQY
jgi:hypothetical protein